MAGEWFEREWDETLFAAAAPHYERGRLPYAPALADVFGRSLALDGNGRLLDVGCGPGTVTLALSGWFRQVVGVDPDREMLREAQRLASERAVANASWVRMRGEDLPGALGAFDVVVFAASFHWMDRPRVAAAVRGMLEPNGVVVHVDNGHQDRLEVVAGLPTVASSSGRSTMSCTRRSRCRRPLRICSGPVSRSSKPISVASSPVRPTAVPSASAFPTTA